MAAIRENWMPLRGQGGGSFDFTYRAAAAPLTPG
jgi:hypothetical protein